MSDASIAFVGAAIGSAIGIIGAVSAVVLDNYLRRRSEARKELERTKIEVYDKLYKLYAGICLLTREGQELPSISKEERKGYLSSITHAKLCPGQGCPAQAGARNGLRQVGLAQVRLNLSLSQIKIFENVLDYL